MRNCKLRKLIVKKKNLINFELFVFRKRQSIQFGGAEKRNSMSSSISQSKINTDPKLVTTQSTISSAIVAADIKPQQILSQTQNYVIETRKETSEAATDTPRWSPEPNGHLMVNKTHIKKLISFI